MSIWFLFAQYRVSMLFMLIFLLLYLPWRYNRKKTILIAVFCFALTGGVDYLQLMVAEHEMQLQVTVAETLLVQLSAFLISDHRDFRTLFTGITSSVYILFGNIFFFAVYAVTQNGWMALAGQILLHALLLAWLNWKVRPWYLLDMERKGTYWCYLWLIPALYYMIIYTMVIWPRNLTLKPESYLTIILVLFQMVFSYGIMLRIFAQNRKDSELLRSKEFLEIYAGRLKHEADELQAKETEAAVFRHDLRHYARLLDGYIEAGEREKARELMKHVNIKLEDTVFRRYCENLSVNGVLSYCSRLAEKEGVRFLTKVDIPQQISVNEIELAAMISNLVENAVSAAAEVSDKKERFVKISAHCARRQLILEVSNRFAGERKISEKTGLPVSENGNGHGYGLMSVQAFAEKNGAVFDYAIENNIFQVRVLINQVTEKNEKI